jgi:hypothetical protein
MKIAKASKEDMDMAIDLVSVLETLERGYIPSQMDEGDEDGYGYFDIDDKTQCREVLKVILGILEKGSIGRVVWGMATLIDPANKVVNPDANALELHPELQKLLSAQSA